MTNNRKYKVSRGVLPDILVYQHYHNNKNNDNDENSLLVPNSINIFLDLITSIYHVKYSVPKQNCRSNFDQAYLLIVLVFGGKIQAIEKMGLELYCY